MHTGKNKFTAAGVRATTSANAYGIYGINEMVTSFLSLIRIFVICAFHLTIATAQRITTAFYAYLTSFNTIISTFKAPFFHILFFRLQFHCYLNGCGNLIGFAVVVVSLFRQILRYVCFHRIVVFSIMSSGSLF